MVTIYTDSTDYYDRVVYPFASLCTQYFGLEVLCLLVLFRIMQMMKIFLYMPFGAPDSFIQEGIEYHSKE